MKVDTAFITSWREGAAAGEIYRETLADLQPALRNAAYDLTSHDGERMTFARRYRPPALIVAAVLWFGLVAFMASSGSDDAPVPLIISAWVGVAAAIFYKRRHELIVTVRALGDAESEVTVAGQATPAAADAVQRVKEIAGAGEDAESKSLA